MRHVHYLDHNATAPLRPAARAAMLAALDDFGNPSSVHGFGRRARHIVEQARAAVAALAGVAPDRVIFTSGATEANATALAEAGGRGVLVSAIEHDSVTAAVPGATAIPVTAAGVLDLAALDRLLATGPAPALVAVMAANNETGVIQPVAEAASLARRHGARLHCDAVQAAGRLPVTLAGLGAATLSLSAHKLGGPAGVGALVLGEGVEVAPLIRGGGQERRRRAGTENVAGIAGFGAAAAAAAAEGIADQDRLAALRDGLERRIRLLCPDAEIFGAGADRLANTSCLTMPGVPAETQVIAFDLAGIAVSAGAACSSGKVAASRVLTAMGVAGDRAGTAIRVSLGAGTTAADIDAFVAAWQALYRRAGRGSGVHPAPGEAGHRGPRAAGSPGA